MPASNATSRFSDRVENYVLYRPGYPGEALQALKEECGLARDHVVADLASGTGIWTRVLLENGNPVFGVEPNAEMRAAGERLLAPIFPLWLFYGLRGLDQPWLVARTGIRRTVVGLLLEGMTQTQRGLIARQGWSFKQVMGRMREWLQRNF